MVRKPILRSRKKAGSGFGGTVWAPGGGAAPGRRSRLPRQKEPGELLSSLCICHTLPFKCQTPNQDTLNVKEKKAFTALFFGKQPGQLRDSRKGFRHQPRRFALSV